MAEAGHEAPTRQTPASEPSMPFVRIMVALSALVGASLIVEKKTRGGHETIVDMNTNRST